MRLLLLSLLLSNIPHYNNFHRITTGNGSTTMLGDLLCSDLVAAAPPRSCCPQRGSLTSSGPIRRRHGHQAPYYLPILDSLSSVYSGCPWAWPPQLIGPETLVEALRRRHLATFPSLVSGPLGPDGDPPSSRLSPSPPIRKWRIPFKGLQRRLVSHSQHLIPKQVPSLEAASLASSCRRELTDPESGLGKRINVNLNSLSMIITRAIYAECITSFELMFFDPLPLNTHIQQQCLVTFTRQNWEVISTVYVYHLTV